MGLVLLAALLVPDDPAVREAIKKVQWLVGEWRTTYRSDEATWIETQNWEFRFGREGWALQFTVKEGRLWKSGVLGYDPGRKTYRLEQTAPDGSTAVFTGPLSKNGDLVLVETDGPRRLTWNFLRDNRFIGTLARRREGASTYLETHRIQFTKQGVPFVRAERPKCVVTGGSGDIEVSYGGKTYAVC